MLSEDLSEVEILSLQLGYPVSPPQLADRFNTILSSSDHLLIVAEAEGVLVGWCHAFRVRLLETEGYAELGGLVVEERHRRRGIGDALLQEAEAWVKYQGASRLRAYSGEHREAAHQFYLSKGYDKNSTPMFQKTVIE